jgi:gamma-glutamylcyclotransferase (GGCT)/AIG2-like uncharacterized protein YtfP
MFAYGYNMDAGEMARRCPGAVALGPARLPGWRFAIGPGGYGTIAPAPGAIVHGVLWRIGPDELRALDAFEGIAARHYRRRLLAAERGGRRLAALAYVGRPGPPGRPARGYLEEVVIPAARWWGLPQRYIREIAGWAAPGRVGAGRRRRRRG